MLITDEIKKQVWQKARTRRNMDPDQWRVDDFGYWIHWDQYGDRKSEYGWEVNSRLPARRSGKEMLSNLRPLQWQNHLIRERGEFPREICDNLEEQVARERGWSGKKWKPIKIRPVKQSRVSKRK